MNEENVIIRHTRRENFTVVNNDYLQDKRLSWKAKGIITYVMSLPADWKININDLVNRSEDGRNSLTTGINELVEFGYCRKQRVKGDGGRFVGYRYEISDKAEFAETPINKEKSPQCDFPQMDFPQMENVHLINTNNIQNTKNNNNIADDEKIVTANPTKEEKAKKHLFRNSAVYNLVKKVNGQYDDSELRKKMPKEEFISVDLVYYFHAVADWSDQRDMKRTDVGWLATIRNFVRGDIERGKLHTLTRHASGMFNDALNFLNNDF